MSATSLPNWPLERVLTESVLAYNLRHPKARLDAQKSAWPLVYRAVQSFIRHELTGYNQRLKNGEKRDVLRCAIKRQARIQYTWLRLDRDPRLPGANHGAVSPQKGLLPYDRMSAKLADLYVRKNALRQVLGEANREEKSGLRQKLTDTEALIDFLSEAMREPELGPGESSCLLRPLKAGEGYFFGPRKLWPNQLLVEAVCCPACGVRVMRSKRPVALGQRKEMVFWSCHCLFFACPPEPHPFAPMSPANWERLLEDVIPKRVTP